MKTSIRSLNLKVRGNAIEIIEQSTEHSIFKMLLPLLDKRDIQEVMYFYENHYPIKEYTLNDILKYSLHSNNELEILLTLITMPKIYPNYHEEFRTKLLSTQNPKIIATIFSQINQEQSIDTINTLLKVSQYKNMHNFNIFMLDLILKDSKIKTYKANKNKQSSLPKYAIILKGECYVNENSYSEGDFINVMDVFSKTQENTQIVTHQEDIELLVLQKASLIDAIEIYPEIGIKFLQ